MDAIRDQSSSTFLHVGFLLHLLPAMKPHSPEPQNGSRAALKNTPKLVLVFTFSLVLSISPLCLVHLLATSVAWRNLTSPFSPTPSPSSSDDFLGVRSGNKSSCDLFRGEWIPNPNAPYYTNDTCWAIYDEQNCIKFGRPDTGFIKWRWKPNDCELPVFNPGQFLELMKDKSLAFVGDSVGRNQMLSLICLLLRVTYTIDGASSQDHKLKRYYFPTHNFTVASIWSPYLVRAVGPTSTDLFDLYLDEPDTYWTAQISQYDYAIISAGHWFLRPTKFYENRQIVGCLYCLDPNITDLSIRYSYRRAFRSAFKALNGMTNFNGMVFLRTFSPAHFENGEWNKGGNCVRQRPFRSNETRLEGYSLEMYLEQLEEYNAAVEEGREKGVKFRLLNTTVASLLRPDGHPSRYGHRARKNITLTNDCVHWCLPGPIDTWNDLLLEMLKNEGV